MAQPAFAHFTLEPASARSARRFVTSTLEQWGRDDLVDVAVLLTGELVGNVVLHAGTGFDIVLVRRSGTLRIEVHDGSPRLPARKHYSVSATTGRGLALVEELARSSGASPTETGKVVWFELDDVGAGEAEASASLRQGERAGAGPSGGGSGPIGYGPAGPPGRRPGRGREVVCSR